MKVELSIEMIIRVIIQRAIANFFNLLIKQHFDKRLEKNVVAIITDIGIV